MIMAEGLLQRFRVEAAARSLGRRTIQTYEFWLRKCYQDLKVPASQWTGETITRWMHHLDGQSYSRVSRTQEVAGWAVGGAGIAGAVRGLVGVGERRRGHAAQGCGVALAGGM